MSSVRESARGPLAAYLVTATLARSGTESAGPALLVVSIAVLGSAATGSYLVAAMTASAALAGPVLGALLDRTASPRGGFALAVGILGIGLAAIAVVIGHAPLGVVVALAAIAGLGYPAITGAWSAQLPRLLPGQSLTRPYAADAASYSIAAVVAPPIVAALVAVSTTAPLWLTAVLIGGAVLSLLRVPLRPPGSDVSRRSLLADLRAGIDVMARNHSLRRTVVITTLGFAGTAAVFVTAPLRAQSLTGSLQFTGVILGAFALGGVITALWFTRHPVTRPDRAIIASTLASAVLLIAIGLAPTPVLLLLAAFAMGATEPPLMSSMFQVRVRESPVDLQSQIFTTSASLRMIAFAIATALCGLLIGVGLWAVIAFGVALHLVAVVVGIVIGPDLPRREHWVRRPSAG